MEFFFLILNVSPKQDHIRSLSFELNFSLILKNDIKYID